MRVCRQECSHDAIEFFGYFFVRKMSHALEHYQAAIVQALLQLVG
jgi:hypothetical protein